VIVWSRARDRPTSRCGFAVAGVSAAVAGGVGAAVIQPAGRSAAIVVTGYGAHHLRVPRARTWRDRFRGDMTLVIFVLCCGCCPRGRSAASGATGCRGAPCTRRRRTAPRSGICDGRPHATRSPNYTRRAYYRGHGPIPSTFLLVTSGWDTLGRFVLLVRRTGVASLVFRHRRLERPAVSMRVSRHRRTSMPSAVAAMSPAAGSELRDPRDRSLVLEVATE